MILALCGLALLLLALALAPVELTLTAEPGGGAYLRLRVFGVSVLRRDLTAQDGGALESPSAAAARKRSARSAPTLRTLKRVWRFAEPFLRPSFGAPGRRWLARTVLSVDVAPRDMRLVFGFPDPATTGLVYGALGPLLEERLVLTPDFSGPRFRLSGALRVRSRLGRLCWPSLRFAAEPDVWRAAWRSLRAGFRRAGAGPRRA